MPAAGGFWSRKGEIMRVEQDTNLSPGAKGATADPGRPDAGYQQRRERGRAARRAVPRGSHAGWAPAPDRPDPVDLLEKQAEGRLEELMPIRYARMMASPFAFLRGSAVVMANDLASTPKSGIQAQLCGDAHLLNFGAYASPERALLFDLNDFDETLPGPWEWDVKRLAVSFVVAGRDNGYSLKDRRNVLLSLLREYRAAMRRFAAMTNLDVWYARVDVERITKRMSAGVDAVARKRAEANLAKARTRDSTQALDKLTHIVDGQRRIISSPPLI